MDLKIVAVIIQNSKGEYLVHKRSDDKKFAPGKYCLGAGGKVDLGETIQEAMNRELFEELKIKAEPKFLFEHDDCFGKYYIHYLKYDGDFDFCKREFSWADWMNYDELKSTILDKGLMASDTQNFFEHFLSEWN